MGSRADALATRVEQANNDLLKAVEATTEEQWRAKCADGEWTQGFSGFHAANSIGFITGMVQGFSVGQTIPPMTMADVDQQNAATHAENAATCTKAQALEAIRTNSPASVQMVRGLSDEQLDKKAKLLTDLPEVTVEQAIEMLLIGHPAGHTQSIVNAR